MDRPTQCPQSNHPMGEKKRRDGTGTFWACTGYPDCKFIWNEPKPAKSFTPTQGMVQKVTAMQDHKGELIKQAQERKDDSIAFFNSTNCAIQMVSQEKEPKNDAQKQMLIKFWREWFLNEWYARQTKSEPFRSN